MVQEMFCFQCEQAAYCAGCTGRAGVCGKTSETARLQDRLTGALIGLARVSNGEAHLAEDVCRLMIRALFATLTNVNFDPQALGQLIDLVHLEQERLVPGCAVCGAPCGRAEDYDMTRLWNAPEDIRSLKSLVLFGLRGMSAYAYHAMVLDFWDDEVGQFFRRALFALGEDWGMDDLLPLALEVGEQNLACMALLDRANTHAFGTPEPAQVSMVVEPGPDSGDRGQRLHPRGDAARPRLSQPAGLSPPKGQLRHRLAESAAGV